MAVLVGERDGGDLGGAEQHAEGERRRRSAATTVRHGIGGRGPDVLGRAGGRAARCARWAAKPGCRRRRRRPRRRARRPGATAVASTVTRIGPMMKTASSSTASNAYAVCTLGGPVEHVGPAGAHARRRSGGRRAPATAADDVRRRRSASPPATDHDQQRHGRRRRRRSPSAQHPAPGRAGRRSRPCRIAKTALAIMYAAETGAGRRRRSRSRPRPAARCRGRPSRSAAARRGRSARTRRAPGWDEDPAVRREHRATSAMAAADRRRIRATLPRMAA